MPSLAVAPHSLSSHRPSMPTFDDETRSIHQATRLGILLDQWQDVESEWLEEHIGAERAQVWGIPDTSANPLADLSRQLSTPGLYGIRPDFRRTQGGGDGLVGPDGHMEQAGFFTRQQFIQYLTLGLSDMFVRWDINNRGQLTCKNVFPHDVYLRAPADDPANPNQLWELGQRFLELEKQWVFVWEVWDLGALNARGEVIREPSYGIFEATPGSAAVKHPVTGGVTTEAKAGGMGRNLTHLFDDRVAPEGTLSGVDYPWKTLEGIPVFPHVHYQDQDTGMLWNTFLKRGAHIGTLNAGLYWTYAGYCAHSATGSYIIVAGLEVGSHEVVQGHGRIDGARGQGTFVGSAGGVPVQTKLVTPGCIDYHNIRDGVTPFVHEVGAGVNLPDVLAFAEQYEMRQAVRWGINASDLSRNANPASAASLMVSNQGKRDASAQATPIFRRKDKESIRNAAIVLRAGGVANFPETGYSTQYFVIPRSVQEQAEHRDDITWKQDQGQMSKIDTYRELNPGTTDDDAQVALVEIAVENALLQRAIDEALTAAGVSDEPDAEPGNQSFETGPGGIGPHTHSLTKGAASTGPGGEDNHTHTVAAGSSRTGTAVEHDHSIPAAFNAATEE